MFVSIFLSVSHCHDAIAFTFILLCREKGWVVMDYMYYKLSSMWLLIKLINCFFDG